MLPFPEHTHTHISYPKIKTHGKVIINSNGFIFAFVVVHSVLLKRLNGFSEMSVFLVLLAEFICSECVCVMCMVIPWRCQVLNYIECDTKWFPNTIYTLCEKWVSIALFEFIGICIWLRLSTLVNNLVWHDLHLKRQISSKYWWDVNAISGIGTIIFCSCSLRSHHLLETSTSDSVTDDVRVHTQHNWYVAIVV